MVNDSIMYAEVFEILGCMKKEIVMKVPLDILEVIKNERSKTYKSRIDKNDLFNPDNIDQRTVNLLGWLMIAYMGTEEEKAEIIRIGKKNDRKAENEKKVKFATEVFAKEEPVKKVLTKDIDEIEENMQIIISETSDSIFTKFINFVKNLFKSKH